MNLRASIEKLINIKNPGILTELLLLPLTLGAFSYGLIVFFRTRLYQWNLLRRHHIPCKVITIGNITVGGTGKTPMVFYLARYLANENYRVVVITRGYRGTGSDKAQVVSDGEKILALSETAGDEAYMLANKLPGIPVLAGKDRVAAGKMAVERFNAQIVILDDGFQYHRLERDLDIVLINARNPFGNGFLLPRGTLREPLTALRRTPMIVLTKIDANADNIKELEDQIRSHNDQTCIFTSFFQPIRLKKVHGVQEIPLNLVGGKKVVGFCSIGDPDSFFGTLNRLKVVLVQKIMFPDHHRYQEADYQLITHWAEEAEYVITTEKDVAKIDMDMIQKKKLFVIQIEQIIDNEEIFSRRINEFAKLFMLGAYDKTKTSSMY